MKLKVIDETLGADTHDIFTLADLNEVMTVRELIRAFVYQQVQEFNSRLNSADGDLQETIVPRTNYEKQLNAGRTKEQRQIDWRAEFEIALEAFQANGFFIFVDEVQAENLDQPFTIATSTEVRFLRVIPLIGG